MLPVVLELLGVPVGDLVGVGDDLEGQRPEYRGVPGQRALHRLARRLEGDPLEPTVPGPGHGDEELRDHEHAALANSLVEHVLPSRPRDLHVGVPSRHINDPVVRHRPVRAVKRVLQTWKKHISVTSITSG